MKIAIKGHKTRGQEVIEILESLGGKQGASPLEGNIESYVYFIKGHLGNLIVCDTINRCVDYKIYTLEEFEKEFPFKIGDLCVYSSEFFNKEIIVKILGIAIKDNCIMYELGHKDIIKAHSGIYKERHTLKHYKEMKEERNITLTLDKAKEWYNNGGELKEVALQAFTEQELNPLPKSWVDYINKYGVPSLKYIFSSNCPNRYVALWKLEQLRDCYRQGWRPDWNNSTKSKYCIVIEYNTLIIRTHGCVNEFLSFQSREIAEEFLKNFKPLIKEAGDLI